MLQKVLFAVCIFGFSEVAYPAQSSQFVLGNRSDCEQSALAIGKGLQKLSEDFQTFWTSTGYRSKVFRGLFKNPNYNDHAALLQEDQQTRRTPQIKAVASLINNKKDQSTLKEIFAVLQGVAPWGRPKGAKIFETTASQVLTQGFATGCTNYAMAFATLARSKGIPTVIVDSADNDWITKGCPLRGVQGHFLVEVFIEGKWVLVDSTSGKLYQNYDRNNRFLPEGRIAFSKALSMIDTGADEKNS